jgi:Domain of unknown function (DUF6457)
MHEWLEQAAARLAAAAGDEADGLNLTADEQRALLELARVAAHESGDRRNAPLVCHIAGVVHGRHPELSLAELVRAAAGDSG